MKRFLTLCLVAALALSASLCIVSCDASDDGKESTSESTSTSTTESSSDTTGETDSTTESESTTETVTPSKVAYTVTVKNEDGAPVAGVEVQICVGDVCKKPQVTDENGNVTFKIDPSDDEMKLQINGGPDGYEYLGADGKIVMDADVTEVTVTLKSLTAA